MWRRPLPCLAPPWSAQGRGWGGEEGWGGAKAQEHRRHWPRGSPRGGEGPEKGQRRAGSGGGGDSVIGAPPPSRHWAGDGRAQGSKLPLRPSQLRSEEGAGLAYPLWLPNLPQLSQGLDLPQAGPDQPLT